MSECYPTPDDLQRLAANAETINEFVNGEEGVPNVNPDGVDVKNLKTLHAEVLQIAFSNSAVIWRESYAALALITDQPKYTVGLVYDDPTPANNGYWIWDEVNWVYSEWQPSSTQDIAAFRAEMANISRAVSLRAKNQFAPLRDKFDGPTVEVRDQAGNIVAGVPVTRNFHERITSLEGESNRSAVMLGLPLRDKLDSGGVDFVDGAGNVLTGTTADLYLLANGGGGGGGSSAPVGDGGDLDSITGLANIDSNGDLRIDTDLLATLGGAGSFTDVVAQYPKAVLADTTRDAHGSNARVMAGGFTRYIIVPTERKVALVLITDGQSLGTGAQGVPLLDYLLRRSYADKLWMPGGTGMDVRFGSIASGTPVAYDLSSFTGFQPMQSRQTATRGSTVVEGMASRMAYELSRNIGHVPLTVACTVAWGGASLATLNGSVMQANREAALQKVADNLRAIGYEPYCPFVEWYHGQGDSSNSGYQSGLLTYQGDFQDLIVGIFGQEQTTVPFLMRQPSGFYEDEGGTIRTHAVRAMYNLAKLYPDRFMLAGCGTGLERAPDNTHLTARGYMHGGEKDMLYVLKYGPWAAQRKPNPMMPQSVTVSGTNVVLTFPEPIAINTRMGVVPNYGFNAFNGSGADVSATITGVTVSGNVVTVAFAEGLPASGASRAIRYALNSTRPTDNGTDPSKNPRGNLCVATVETSIADGAPLHDWIVHFSEAF